MNYYKHETKVKVIDGILAHAQDWEWFIQLTENDFSVELNGNSLHSVLTSFQDVQEVFNFLSKIHEITKTNLNITKEWLEEIDLLAQFYVGKLDLCNIELKSDFSKVMRVLIYAGKIYGQNKNQKYFYYSDIFTLRNLFNRDNLELFVDEEQTIIRLIDEVAPILNEERQVFLDNILGIEYDADEAFILRHMDRINSANCFSFQSIHDDNIRVWEESELLKILSVSVKNGEIVPSWSDGDNCYPDYTVWTMEMLQHIRDYFKSSAVTFIIESIGYVLHDVIPSPDTINNHFSLLHDLSEKTEEQYQLIMNCSSFEIILTFFTNECKSFISHDSYINYSQFQNKLYNKGCKSLLIKLKNNNALTNKDVKQKLKAEEIAYRDKVEDITDYRSFVEYLKNDSIRGAISNIHFQVLSKKFDSIVDVVDGVSVADLFLMYFEFLLKIKNNKDISGSDISAEILRIRSMWRNRYYIISSQALDRISSESIQIPKDCSAQLVKLIYHSPMTFANKIIKLQDKDLIIRMQQISDLPLFLMVSKIIISEDFPAHPFLKIDGKHPIDELYLKNIERIVGEYGYKFRNIVSAKEYVEGLFQGIKTDLQFTMALIKDVEVLYNAVIEHNPDYWFLEYTEELRLGHITQLFPILENKIREFGELCGIVPVRENIGESHRLKEPDGVLKTIISQVLELGGSLDIVADLFFIHFCMFGENGLNIRNACVHGLDYCKGKYLDFAFKVSLISLYMIGCRTQLVINNVNQNEVNHSARITLDNKISIKSKLKKIIKKTINNICKLFRK